MQGRKIKPSRHTSPKGLVNEETSTVICERRLPKKWNLLRRGWARSQGIDHWQRCRRNRSFQLSRKSAVCTKLRSKPEFGWRNPGIDSASLCSLVARCDNPDCQPARLHTVVYGGINSWATKTFTNTGSGSLFLVNRFEMTVEEKFCPYFYIHRPI